MEKKNEELERAKKALSDFLEEHPELQEYQDEIQRRLSKAPTFEQRMKIIEFMMMERLAALKESVDVLKEVQNV